MAGADVDARSSAEREASLGWLIGNLDDDGATCRADLAGDLATPGRCARFEAVEGPRGQVAATSIPPASPRATCASACSSRLPHPTRRADAAGPAHDRRPPRRAPEARLPRDRPSALERRDRRGRPTRPNYIGTLEPRPGRPFGGEEPVYIVPDIYVHKIGDDFHVVLNEDGMPRLRINQLYRDVLAQRRGGRRQRTRKEYVQRQGAVGVVADQVDPPAPAHDLQGDAEHHQAFQREFFDRGIQALRPLNLRDVAEDIGMHESTVSRVTTNKYAHTPQGIFELKYFFNSSINSGGRRGDRQRERQGEDPPADHRCRGPALVRSRTSASPRCCASPTSTSPGARSRSTASR